MTKVTSFSTPNRKIRKLKYDKRKNLATYIHYMNIFTYIHAHKLNFLYYTHMYIKMYIVYVVMYTCTHVHYIHTCTDVHCALNIHSYVHTLRTT